MILDKKFGAFGGQYVPETLMNPLIELEEAFKSYCFTEEFRKEYMHYLNQYVGRPSPLYFAKRLTEYAGGAKIYLKREDLNHTGAHKINNVIGQILLAKHMGKKRVIAETGAGQHGVATATGAALFDLECEVFMGEEDTRRQALNVFKMELLGSKVRTVTSGTKTLKDATNAAIREWVSRAEDTLYIIGSAVGPHPYPTMVREFQKIIGEETKIQIMEQEGRLPQAIVACVGGGSNAIGMFADFLEEKDVKLYGVEAGGHGLESGEHAITFNGGGRIGVLHGMKSYLLQDEEGQVLPVYSISAGLDYPGVGPQHAHLFETGRVKYLPINDDEAMEAFDLLCKKEGIIPAIESAHAVAEGIKLAKEMKKEELLIINLSGRGDKDVDTVLHYFRGENNKGESR